MNGTVSFASAVKNGFKSSGTTTNAGSIIMSDNVTDGIQVLGGTFTNAGSISISKPGDDCLEILNGSTFNNEGTLSLVAKDSAGTANNAILVGLDTVPAIFFNAASGMIVAHAGGKETARAISIGGLGSLTNEGKITLSGLPNGTSRLYTRGTFNNAFNSILDLGDARGNVNLGAFVNNGLVKSTREGAGLFCAATTTVVNNAFFDYVNATLFAAGTGTITNNGISLNTPNQSTISAMNPCQVDIAQQPYTWYEGSNLVAMASDTGLLVFPALSVSDDSVTLVTTIPGVKVNVKRICAAAYETSSVFDPTTRAERLGIQPSLLQNGGNIQVTVPVAFENADIRFDLFSQDGQRLHSLESSAGATTRNLQLGNMRAGSYLLRGTGNAGALIGRFVVVQ